MSILLTGEGTPAQRLRALREVTTPERIRKLRALPYAQFLRTGYWSIIRAYVLSRQPACERCERTRDLQVHHTTYHHHGLEHDHTEDLQVLCRQCHMLEHGIRHARLGWNGHGMAHAAEYLPDVMRALAEMNGSAPPEIERWFR